MAAAPQYASFTLVGRSGRTYQLDAYFSDVANASVKWDGGAGASSTSPDFYTAPEDCILTDYSQVTGLTDTAKVSITRNNVPTGNILRAAIHLTTLNNRPKLQLPFKAGDKIAGVQLA